jgi:hypothetical protein
LWDELSFQANENNESTIVGILSIARMCLLWQIWGAVAFTRLANKKIIKFFRKIRLKMLDENIFCMRSEKLYLLRQAILIA